MGRVKAVNYGGFVSIEKLPELFIRTNKKRKITTNNCKKPPQNSQSAAKSNEIYYKRINPPLTYKKIISFLKARPKTYVESENGERTLALYKMCEECKKKLNSNEKYRAINGQCLIEVVAASYAHEVLLSKSFNMFESFKKLCSLAKVYKKEAEILNALTIMHLASIYVILLKDIKKIKTEVKRGSRVKRLKRPNSNLIYGAYMFNPSCLKLRLSKAMIINATNLVLQTLDECSEKMRIIFNYARFLYGGLK